MLKNIFYSLRFLYFLLVDGFKIPREHRKHQGSLKVHGGRLYVQCFNKLKPLFTTTVHEFHVPFLGAFEWHRKTPLWIDSTPLPGIARPKGEWQPVPPPTSEQILVKSYQTLRDGWNNGAKSPELTKVIVDQLKE